MEAQLDHALAFLPHLSPPPGPGVGVDLGSGGGIPGLVLAWCLPTVTWRLVDSMVRRTSFLRSAVDELDLAARVGVVTARAEEVGRADRAVADVVTARGFGPPAVLAECAAPLLRVGGRLVVSEPPGGDPARWPAAPLAELGLAVVTIEPGPPAFAVLEQVELAPLSAPRRSGLPAKRPRW